MDAAVDLGIARIGGHLGLRSARCAGKLDMSGLEVQGSLFMEPLGVQGDQAAQFAEVDLRNAQIGGHLSLHGARCTGPLILHSAQIGGHLSLHGAHCTGGLDLRNLEVKSDLLMDTTEVQGDKPRQNFLSAGGELTRPCLIDISSTSHQGRKARRMRPSIYQS